MLVPSYSSGKTRSLRIPRLVFYCILGVVFVASSITAGLWISRQRFAQQYQETSEYLYYTQYRFDAFQDKTLEEQARMLEESSLLYEQLTDEQRQARIQRFLLEQQQQNALNELRMQLDELEQMIRYFDEQRQASIDGLSSRLFIPPVSAMHTLLVQSQAEMLTESVLFGMPAYENGYAVTETEAVGAVGTAGFVHFSDETFISPLALNESYLHGRIDMLKAELELQMLLHEDLQARKRSMDPHLKNFPTMWPVNAQISSPFGWRRNPFGSGSEFHHGIDLRAPSGTPIRAAGGGTVIFNGWQSGYGNTIILCHGNGYTTLYAHNSVNLASVGQRVERGDIIARVGTTGRVTGAHVHFEVRINGERVNPRPYMIER